MKQITQFFLEGESPTLNCIYTVLKTGAISVVGLSSVAVT